MSWLRAVLVGLLVLGGCSVMALTDRLHENWRRDALCEAHQGVTVRDEFGTVISCVSKACRMTISGW